MKWLRIFSRRRRLVVPETWRAGDVAECICTHGFWLTLTDDRKKVGPEKGARCIVLGVQHFGGVAGPYLRLTGWSGWWEAAAFRKIVPTASDRAVTARAPVPPAGSGSRPDATPLPDPAKPALEPAGEVTPKPETEHA